MHDNVLPVIPNFINLYHNPLWVDPMTTTMRDQLPIYVIKFVSDLWQVSGFLRVADTPVSSTIKNVHHDIIEILLIVALNTILPPIFYSHWDLAFCKFWFFGGFFFKLFYDSRDPSSESDRIINVLTIAI